MWGGGGGAPQNPSRQPPPSLPRPASRRLLRSAGVRFAAIYALLLAVSAAALAMFLWWATAGLLDRQTDAAIEADAQSLTERYDEAGLPALVVTIEDRLTQDVEDDAIYLLVGPGGPAHRRQPAALAARRGAQRRLVRTADRARRHALAGAGAKPTNCQAASIC